jgi:hypothetical protein
MAFSGNAPRRDIFSLFTKAGEYDYTCPMHFMANYGEKEGMFGTIIVKDGHKGSALILKQHLFPGPGFKS